MEKFKVDWSVVSVINGTGQHDDGVRDGQRRVVATGSVVKEAESEEVIRTELTAMLAAQWPATQNGPTYDILHFYEISIEGGLKTRRQHIIDQLTDGMSDLFYYDRKEDEDLPRGAIEAAVKAGEITAEEMIAIWSAELMDALKESS